MKPKKVISAYVGPLTADEIVSGITAAQSNALRLLDDAKLLYEAKRWPSAVSLAILAMEERGKVGILKLLALVSDPTDIKKIWKDYRSHRAKNSGWIIPTLVARGARKMTDFAEALDPQADHTAMLDTLKQIGFYTDCLGDKKWSHPIDVIEKDLAKSIIDSAETFWASREVNKREIELWIEFVKPHFGTQDMGNSVIRFQNAMFNEGLSDTHPDALAAFIYGRPFSA